MPYISKNNDRREKLRKGEPALNAGELNYQIFYYVKNEKKPLCEKVKKFVDRFLGKKPNYQRYNDMTGVMTRCSKELYRRLGLDEPTLIDIMNSYDDEIAKYEDKKCSENGDVE